MALIKCPECGNNVSDQAAACIHCGYPLKSAQDSTPKYAQIRVMMRAPKITVDGKSVSQGSIVDVFVNGSREVLVTAWGGDVGMLGGSKSFRVVAGHKYDLAVHTTMVGRMPYLKEVFSFM